MENFYKITPAQAALIGKFNYSSFEAIDPFVGEQKDGSYLISEKCYLLLQEHTKMKLIDFTKCELVSKEQLDPKETDITIGRNENIKPI